MTCARTRYKTAPSCSAEAAPGAGSDDRALYRRASSTDDEPRPVDSPLGRDQEGKPPAGGGCTASEADARRAPSHRPSFAPFREHYATTLVDRRLLRQPPSPVESRKGHASFSCWHDTRQFTKNSNLSLLSGRPEGTGGGCTWAAATAAAGVGPPATASTLASNTLAPRRRAGWGRLRRPFRLLGPRRPFRLLVAQGTMAVEREVVRRAR